MAEKEEGAKKGGDGLDKAADRLRDSAKWLIAAFGAVATVIFAGLTVSDLGELSWDTPGHRMTLALVGGAAAIVGIAYALSVAMRLAGASTMSTRDLTRKAQPWEFSLKSARAEVASAPALAAWGGSFTALVAEQSEAYEDVVAWQRAYVTDPAVEPSAAQLEKAGYRLEALGNITNAALAGTSFLRLHRSFELSRHLIVGAMVVAAFGAVLFGWATSNIPDSLDLGVRPQRAVLQPSKAVLDELNRQLDKPCDFGDTAKIPVIVLAAGDDKVEVVTIPDLGSPCPPARADDVPESEVTSP